MSGEAIPFTIRYHTVEDFFNCPVCMCQMKDTYTTPCGHRYCERCIKEWIDRNRKCPCCNADVRRNQLIKDRQFDDLIAVVDREKAASEKLYFENLINEASPSMDDTSSQAAKTLLSPIETVLKHHLKDSLIAHEKYYQDLTKQVQKKQEEIEIDFERHCTEAIAMGATEEEIARGRTEGEAEKAEKVRVLHEDLERTTSCVSQAYDKYLREHIPSLTILPVRVDIVLLSKNVTLRDIQIKAQDSTEDIKSRICMEMQKKGDNVIGFGDDVQLFAFGPFSKRTPYEMLDIVHNMVHNGACHPDIHSVSAHARPVMQHAMKPGSVIAVYGQVQYESDLPKQCFSQTFTKGQGQQMDYFTCKQCSFHWICRPCMEQCHRDHEVVPYIIGHQPTWGCCYCPKKKTCVILNP